MTTIVENLFAINGVISTDKSVLQNLNALCTSAGAWMTYDISDGKWSVVINRAGSSVASFNDTNIIGGINVSSTGVNELYNSVTVEFPHKDLRDQTDYIDFEIPESERFPNELDNRLNISLDLINDPIQAAYIASAELKQSRVDKVIEFRTDFSKLGLKAGDLIDVTNSIYGYTNKMFRITKMQEEDAEGLVISITALEYNSDVYSTDGLIRTLREKKTGITPKAANSTLQALDAKSFRVELTQNAREHGLVLYYLQGAAYNIWRIGYNEGSMANIDAASAQVEFYFRSPGRDLDIRAKIVSPNVSQTTYLGYRDTGQISRWPATGTALIIWGGDNQGTGSENCAINIEAIKNAYPNTRYIVIECRGIWGTDNIPPYWHPSNPVFLKGTIWQGGSLVPTGVGFTNPTAVSTANIEGVYVNVTHSYLDYGNNGDVDGDFMGYLVFDTVDLLAYFSQTNPAA